MKKEKKCQSFWRKKPHLGFDIFLLYVLVPKFCAFDRNKNCTFSLLTSGTIDRYWPLTCAVIFATRIKDFWVVVLHVIFGEKTLKKKNKKGKIGGTGGGDNNKRISEFWPGVVVWFSGNARLSVVSLRVFSPRIKKW